MLYWPLLRFWWFHALYLGFATLLYLLSLVAFRNTGLEEMQVDHYNAEPDKLCTWLVYELADLCFPFFYRKHLFILLPTFSGIPAFAPNFQNFVTISVKKGTMCIAIIKIGVRESILRASWEKLFKFFCSLLLVKYFCTMYLGCELTNCRSSEASWCQVLRTAHNYLPWFL